MVNKSSIFSSTMMFLGILLCFTLIIEFGHFDTRLADTFYAWGGNHWQLKNAWVTAVLIHKWGKYFSIAIVLIVLSIWGSSFVWPTFTHWKSRLQYLLIASLSGSLLVSTAKSITNISCPWDFSRYGGTQEYLSLIEQLWVRNGSHCFPAGHASAGFAWVAIYFVGLHTRSLWRWWGLACALLCGCIFGFSQQLRGAHFLSHDLWSFGFCWMVSLIYYHLLLKPLEINQ